MPAARAGDVDRTTARAVHPAKVQTRMALIDFLQVLKMMI